MKPQSLLGIVLICVGVLILIYQGFTYSHREQVIKAGPIDISADKEEHVPISPIIGVVCLGGGLFLFVLSSGKKV